MLTTRIASPPRRNGRGAHVVWLDPREEFAWRRSISLCVGESLVGDGNEVAHIDLIIGPRGSAAESAFANALTNNKDGFTSLLAVVAPNLRPSPHTVLFNKVTIKGAKQAVQMFGPAQHAVAKAVADSVADGTIPAGRGRRPVHLRRRVHPLGSGRRQEDPRLQLSAPSRNRSSAPSAAIRRRRKSFRSAIRPSTRSAPKVVARNRCAGNKRLPRASSPCDRFGAVSTSPVDSDAHEVHGRARAQLLLELGAVVGDRLVGDIEEHRRSRPSCGPPPGGEGFRVRGRSSSRPRRGWDRRAGRRSAAPSRGADSARRSPTCLTAPANKRRIVVLGDIAFGAGLDGARGDDRIVIHAEDDEPRLGARSMMRRRSSRPEYPGRLMSTIATSGSKSK